MLLGAAVILVVIVSIGALFFNVAIEVSDKKFRVPLAISMPISVLSGIALAALAFVAFVALVFNVPAWEYVGYAKIPLIIFAISTTIWIGSEWLETKVGLYLRQNVGNFEQFFRFFIVLLSHKASASQDRRFDKLPIRPFF